MSEHLHDLFTHHPRTSIGLGIFAVAELVVLVCKAVF